jgi:hypothetical protein
VNANINSTTKTHLIRGAFYVLLFLAVFVVLVTLGQQSSGNSALDPTKGNRMAIDWRQFNSVSSNFRQSGYGVST